MRLESEAPGSRLADGDAIAVGPPWNHLIPDVLNGRVLLIKRGLQQLGLFTALRGHVTDAIDEIADEKRDALAEGCGLEQLHRRFGECDYPRLISRFDALSSIDVVGTFAQLVPGLIPPGRPIYFFRRIFLRVRPPDPALRIDRFAGHVGSLQALSAHRDTWFGHPTNMVNVWAALGRISEANGIEFYPEVWGRALPHDRTRISPNVALGRALRCALEPGDLLLFGAEQLHASVPNESDETRISVSIRFTLGAPHYEHRNGWIPYEDERLLESGHPWLRTYRSRMTRAFLRSAPERIGPWLRRTITREPYRRV